MSDAIIKACAVTTSVKNTGKECDIAMVAAAMFIALDPTVTFTLTDLEQPVPWLIGLIQERKAFPLFGYEAPIRSIKPSSDSDTIVTLDDGLKVFMKYGVYTTEYGTTSGGLCYAKALASFLNSGMRMLKIDQIGQMMARKNNDGTFSGLITDFMYAPAPIEADFTSTPYMNRFQLSQNPGEIMNNGIVFRNANALLAMMGLIDAEILAGTQVATTTEVYVKVTTECKGTDLIDQIGADLAKAAMYKIKNKATGANVVITAAAIVGGELKLSATLVSAQTYTIVGATPEVWGAQTPAVNGYDASDTGGGGVDILIP